MAKQIRVLTPAWWDKKQHIGFTDGVDTYCCETQPSWFVRVPSVGYEGYFLKRDLKSSSKRVKARSAYADGRELIMIY